MRRLFLVGLALCAGCGEGASTSKIRLVPNVVSGTQSATAQTSELSVRQSALRIGSPAAVNLKSLKYFIKSIRICQDVQLMGTGYSNSSGCINLYENQAAAPPDYEGYLVTQAQEDAATDRYVDLMTAAGQAALRRPVTLQIPTPPPEKDFKGADGGMSQEGAYRYGLIDFYRPIKVTAEFPIVGQADQYFRTRAVTHITTGRTPDGRFNTERVQIGDTLSGPTEETTYMLDNGGALFTFQKPFLITKEDVDAQAEIKVDLVFNPDNFGQAYESNDCANDSHSAICDTANDVVIDMPFVHLNPVPRKAGQKTRKETYLMDYDASSKLRIELYYNDGDQEAGVQGVDSTVVYTGTTNMPNNNIVATNFVSQQGSVRTSDASLTLLDYQHTPNLTGLLRRQDGTATVHCLFTGAICPTPGLTVERPYTFVGDTLVSED